MPLFILAGFDEKFQFRLFKLAHAEDEVLGGDFVAERLADLGDAERQLARRGIDDVLKLGENRLRGFGAQVGDVVFVDDGADGGFEHQVERARFGQIRRAAVRAFAVG